LANNFYYSMEINYLVNGPITQKVVAHLFEEMGSRTDSGGHSLFLGQVRADVNSGKKVVAIEYSAYEEMVKSEAGKIKEIILSEFEDVKAVEIVHSTGIVKAGEISLLVLVSAGHRHQAIQACSKAVEIIKEKFPVWKKEIFDNDSHEWKL
jgi:molybdopterin synthase catalytic subunit